MNIETIANSGQCFRLNKVSWKHYELVAKGKVINIYDNGDSFIFHPLYEWVFDYFNVDSYREINDPDPFLLKAILISLLPIFSVKP